jgi:hypothetical protein
MRRFLVTVGAVLALGGIPASGAFAASTGAHEQPSQSCQDFFATGALVPAGFNTNGFNNIATSMYAGSQPQNSVNPKAVSQYDVACFQATQRP